MAALQRATWHLLLIVGLSITLPTAQANHTALPACGYQGGFGNTFILSSMVTPFSGPSLGKIYVDEPRGLMFTTWNNGVSGTSLQQTEFILFVNGAPLQHGGRCEASCKKAHTCPFQHVSQSSKFPGDIMAATGSVPTLKYRP